eukprot:1820683-Rhodomonas_salina.2
MLTIVAPDMGPPGSGIPYVSTDLDGPGAGHGRHVTEHTGGAEQERGGELRAIGIGFCECETCDCQPTLWNREGREPYAWYQPTRRQYWTDA